MSKQKKNTKQGDGIIKRQSDRTQILYVRIKNDNLDYVSELSDKMALSRSVVVDNILDAARKNK